MNRDEERMEAEIRRLENKLAAAETLNVTLGGLLAASILWQIIPFIDRVFR